MKIRQGQTKERKWSREKVLKIAARYKIQRHRYKRKPEARALQKEAEQRNDRKGVIWSKEPAEPWKVWNKTAQGSVLKNKSPNHVHHFTDTESKQNFSLLSQLRFYFRGEPTQNPKEVNYSKAPEPKLYLRLERQQGKMKTQDTKHLHPPLQSKGSCDT